MKNGELGGPKGFWPINVLVEVVRHLFGGELRRKRLPDLSTKRGVRALATLALSADLFLIVHVTIRGVSGYHSICVRDRMVYDSLLHEPIPVSLYEFDKAHAVYELHLPA